MYKLFIVIVASVITSSCRSNYTEKVSKDSGFSTEKQPVYGNDSLRFKKFISKFKPLAYPFEVDTDCYSPEESDYQRFDKTNDGSFMKETDEYIAVGILPDSTNFYAVVYAAPAVCYLPFLATYSKEGRMIGEEQLGNGCGGDCGYSCSDRLTINSLTDITLKNIAEMYECDSLGKETPGTWEKSIEIKKCSVDKDGNIASKVTSSKETKK